MFICRCCFLVVCCFVSLGAKAATGRGESAVGSLDTVSPELVGITVPSESSINLSFNEVMLAPGDTTPEYYSISGLGSGTFTVHPDAVVGNGSYTLHWNTGEMLDGEPVLITVNGVQDIVGNPVTTAGNSIAAMGKGIPPDFTEFVVEPSRACAGEEVVITFMTSESLLNEPEVSVNSNLANWVSGGKSTLYTFSYTVQDEDLIGMATITVSGFDLAGNSGALTNTLALEIVDPEPEVPICLWPVTVSLLVAGMLALLLRRRRTGTLLLFAALLLFFAPAAFAQSPEVTNVSFTQALGGSSTKVDIYYDLVAPNGPCEITVWLSKDAGIDDYIHPVTSITGDITGVETGTGKHITWDIRGDYPEEDIPQARIRIIVDDGIVQYTLSYITGTGGTITGETTQTVNQGENGTEVTAVPDPGHQFVQWSDGVLTPSRTDTNITGSIIVSAEFIPDTEPPVITLLGNDTVTVECGSTYEDAGATAYDANDGDLTSSIITGGDTVETSFPGTYIITYNVSDVAANAAVAVTRLVTVTDTSAPVITLSGTSPLTLDCGVVYTDAGAIASDTCDGDISSSIIVGGDIVDTSIPGSYSAVYNVNDSVGNSAVEVIRTVHVLDTAPPPC